MEQTLEFRLDLPDASLEDLEKQLRRHRFSGSFAAARATLEAGQYIASTPQVEYEQRMNGSPLIMRLHCAVASIYDHLGDYERAEGFISRWSEGNHARIVKLLNSVTSGGAPPEDLVEEVDRARAWLLQVSGVMSFRQGRLENASRSLTDAIDLVRLLPETNTLSTERQVERLVALAVKYYWRGRVGTVWGEHAPYSDLIEALALLREALDRAIGIKSDYSDGGHFLATHVLICLADLRFQHGALREALAYVNTALLLPWNSDDDNGRLEATILLLAIRRLTEPTERPSIKQKLASIVHELEDPNRPSRNQHLYIFSLSTLCSVELEEAGALHDQEPRPESKTEREALLKSWVRRLDDASGFAQATLASDRADLNCRKLQVLLALDPNEAIAWGEVIRTLPVMRDHPIDHLYTLITLGRAYFRVGKTTGDSGYLQKAKELFLEVERQGCRPRLRAISILNLAKISMAAGQIDEARAYLQLWDELKRFVDIPWIHRLGEEAQSEANKSAILVINPSDLPAEKAYAKVEADVRRFLLNSFPKLSPDEHATRLGVSRATIYKWKGLLSADTAEDV